MNFAKRLFTMTLAIVMVLVLAVPAFAAGDHSITITTTLDGHTYEAYQIFTGTVVDKSTGDILTNPVWGSSINPGKLVDWTVGGTNYNLNLIEALSHDEVNPNMYDVFDDIAHDDPKLAEKIAEALSGQTVLSSTEAGMQFARIVGEYLETPAGSDDTAEAYNLDGYAFKYVISGLDDGYYLIKDKDGIDLNSASRTSYILQLVEDVTVATKSGRVTVDKVLFDGLTQTKVADFSIGDEVQMKATGTIPYNYVRFEEFEYKFTETLDKGLKINAAPGTNITVPELTVRLENDGSPVIIDPSKYRVNLSVVVSGSDEHYVMEVIIDDLKQVNAISNSTKIMLDYPVTIDSDAVTGNGTAAGNASTTVITFSADPYDKTVKEDTVAATAHVFTYELDLTKKDGTTNAVLENGEFKLYRVHASGKQYVEADKVGNKYIVKGYKADDSEPSATSEGTTFVSDANGKIIIVGLEASEYIIAEIKEPVGYNKIAPIDFSISATYNNPGDYKCNALAIRVSGGSDQPGNVNDGVVSMDIINNPGKTLPSTGGIGTTIFYVVGGIMVAGAAILLITKKRMEI